jgi:hypothetical protein
MRTLLAADYLLLARALMAHPAGRRRRVAERLIHEAEEADDYFRHTRRCHPAFGDGSLTARILALEPSREPLASDLDFLDSARTAALALAMHYRARLPASQL